MFIFLGASPSIECSMSVLLKKSMINKADDKSPLNNFGARQTGGDL